MATATIQATINGTPVRVPAGTTVLEAAKTCGCFIPTLCYHQRLQPYGACRICQVELTAEGRPKGMLVASCTHPLAEGDKVVTETDEIMEARRFILQLMLARSPGAKAVMELAKKYQVEMKEDDKDAFQAYLAAKTKKRAELAGPEGLTQCMLCGLCTRVCREVVGREGISVVARGPNRRVRTPFGGVSPSCIGCGACAYICPNSAIKVERAAD